MLTAFVPHSLQTLHIISALIHSPPYLFPRPRLAKKYASPANLGCRQCRSISFHAPYLQRPHSTRSGSPPTPNSAKLRVSESNEACFNCRTEAISVKIHSVSLHLYFTLRHPLAQGCFTYSFPDHPPLKNKNAVAEKQKCTKINFYVY